MDADDSDRPSPLAALLTAEPSDDRLPADDGGESSSAADFFFFFFLIFFFFFAVFDLDTSVIWDNPKKKKWNVLNVTWL